MLDVSTNSKLPSERGLNGLIHKIAPSKFPLKPTTESEFVKLVQRRLADNKGPVSIEVEGGISSVEGGVLTAAVGTIGTFEYAVVCYAKFGNGEKIQYERPILKRFGAERGFTDINNRTVAAITAVLCSDEQMTRLKRDLPTANVYVNTSKGRMTDEIRKQLHADASKVGINVSEISQYFQEN